MKNLNTTPFTIVSQSPSAVHMKTIKETSSLTGVSEHHIRLLCKGNKIKYIRAGSKYLVNYERFLDYLNGES